MNKKIKITIISIIIFIVGISIGVISTNVYFNNKEPKEQKQPESNIKVSPYTLDELYAIVEDPEKFREMNKQITENEYAEVMFHFYDYFSKSTPVKVAKKVELDENGHVIKVLEFEYLSYDEYMKRMDTGHQHERDVNEDCESRLEKEPNLIKENKNWLKECKEMGYNHYIYDLVGIDM